MIWSQAGQAGSQDLPSTALRIVSECADAVGGVVAIGPEPGANGRRVGPVHLHGRITSMDEKTDGQLRVIREVVAVLRAEDISAWLFGGWGLDARIGRITREHGDVEFWVERIHAERSKALLVGAGATALPTQPPEESCEFTWDDVSFSTAYFDRWPDGSFSQPLGRFADWLFPPGSFGDERVTLDGTPVLVMSVSGMLAMKEQFPHLGNGRPWRPKDITDMEILRGMASAETIDGRVESTLSSSGHEMD
jgi:hypothetical protein